MHSLNSFKNARDCKEYHKSHQCNNDWQDECNCDCQDDCHKDFHNKWECPKCNNKCHKDWHKCPWCGHDFHKECC